MYRKSRFRTNRILKNILFFFSPRVDSKNDGGINLLRYTRGYAFNGPTSSKRVVEPTPVDYANADAGMTWHPGPCKRTYVGPCVIMQRGEKSHG